MSLSTTPPRETPWLSMRESAEYLGCAERTIRAYIARGNLKASRVPGSRLVRIKRADLDALLIPVPTTGSE
jgi:excisionase family DNA binding protein